MTDKSHGRRDTTLNIDLSWSFYINMCTDRRNTTLNIDLSWSFYINMCTDHAESFIDFTSHNVWLTSLSNFIP
jgi:hypothetical protein